ncbi:uncharacterized protein LOC108151765 isoform X2 [Drosophila miranda]|uniref:uncharacterized protein LOC108151765 isoform X2 n=1 Tax=Drosophila miranda TaxID=7229 RepID=UPI0007E7C9DD|nr:uncharacterized protein LOC108151765 isoform X2 [Drosophila miranda]
MALSSFRFLANFQRFQRFSTRGGSGRRGDEDGSSKTDQRDASVTADIGATNAKYVEHLFSKWLEDESSIHVSWQKYFREMVKGNSEDQVQGNTEDPAQVNSEDPVPLEPDTTPSPGAIKDLRKEKTGRESSLMTEEDSVGSSMPMDYVDLFLKLEKTKAPRSIELPRPQAKLDGDGPTTTDTPTSLIDAIDPQSDILIGTTVLSPFLESSSNKDNDTTTPKSPTRELLGKISKNVKAKADRARKIMQRSQRLPKTLPNKNPKLLKTQKLEDAPKNTKRRLNIFKMQVSDDKKEAETEKTLSESSENKPIYLYKVGSSGSVDYFRPITDRRSLQQTTQDCAKEKSPLPGGKQKAKKYGTRLNRKAPPNPRNVEASMRIQKAVYKAADKPGSESSEKKSRGQKRADKPGPSVKYRQLAKRSNLGHKNRSESEMGPDSGLSEKRRDPEDKSPEDSPRREKTNEPILRPLSTRPSPDRSTFNPNKF